MEASAVTAQGRISHEDLGIWNHNQIAGLKEVVDLIHEHGAKAAIQLAHAGRKAAIEGTIIAPSAIPFNDSYKTPMEMTKEQIAETKDAFVTAAKRAIAAGFDCLEIHAAHGYLINEFLSPLTKSEGR